MSLKQDSSDDQKRKYFEELSKLFSRSSLKAETSAGQSVSKTHSRLQILANLEGPDSIGLQKSFLSPSVC